MELFLYIKNRFFIKKLILCAVLLFIAFFLISKFEFFYNYQEMDTSQFVPNPICPNFGQFVPFVSQFVPLCQFVPA